MPVGIDIGKNSLHIVGHDGRGAIVLRQKWSRGQVEARFANMPPCLVGMEACVGAHHLSRKHRALGHDARLMLAKYVPYSKGQKNDFRDAEAIANASQTGSMAQAWAADALYLRVRSATRFAIRFMTDLSLSAVTVGGGQLGLLMRIASVFSFVVLSVATFPAQAQDLPEHTVLAFNLTSCPKGWVEFAPAAGAFVVGVGDAFQLGRSGAGPANVTVADASGSSTKKSNVAGLLFCERNKNRR